MSFDRFLGRPYLTTLELPPVPTGFVDADAQAGSGKYKAETTLVPGRVSTLVGTNLGVSLISPGGCTKIRVIYKFSVGYSTFATVIPGPGYVSSMCGLDFLVVRRGIDGSMSTFSDARQILVHTWVLITGVGDSRTETAREHEFGIELGSPTAEGEIWTFFFRAFAEVGGGGFFIFAGHAAVTGTVHGFRVIGS